MIKKFLRSKKTISSAWDITISYPKDIEVFLEDLYLRTWKSKSTNEVSGSLMVMIDLIREERVIMLYLLGHTDDADIRIYKYPSNWELSSARAAKGGSLFEKGECPEID